MNSTKILFLKMLKGDVKRWACEQANIEPSSVSNDNLSLLTGQTIKRSTIESFSSYKLMNEDERLLVNSILSEMTHDVGGEKGRALVKHIETLAPRSEEVVDFKEAA